MIFLQRRNRETMLLFWGTIKLYLGLGTELGADRLVLERLF